MFIIQIYTQHNINNTETLQHLIFQCLKIKPIIEELNTMIIALCDQNYVLIEEYYVGYFYLKGEIL
jgi:hypothetical protein